MAPVLGKKAEDRVEQQVDGFVEGTFGPCARAVGLSPWALLSSVLGFFVLAFAGVLVRDAFRAELAGMEHVSVTDAARMEEVWGSGQPWLLVCRDARGPLELLLRPLARMAGELREGEGGGVGVVRVGTLDCGAALPSGKTTFERLGVSKESGLSVLTLSNGQGPRLVPGGLVQGLTGAGAQTEEKAKGQGESKRAESAYGAFLKHVRDATKRSVPVWRADDSAALRKVARAAAASTTGDLPTLPKLPAASDGAGAAGSAGARWMRGVADGSLDRARLALGRGWGLVVVAPTARGASESVRSATRWVAEHYRRATVAATFADRVHWAGLPAHAAEALAALARSARNAKAAGATHAAAGDPVAVALLFSPHSDEKRVSVQAVPLPDDADLALSALWAALEKTRRRSEANLESVPVDKLALEPLQPAQEGHTSPDSDDDRTPPRARRPRRAQQDDEQDAERVERGQGQENKQQRGSGSGGKAPKDERLVRREERARRREQRRADEERERQESGSGAGDREATPTPTPKPAPRRDADEDDWNFDAASNDDDRDDDDDDDDHFFASRDADEEDEDDVLDLDEL